MQRFVIYLMLTVCFFACNKNNSVSKKLNLSPEFKKYWYSGKAELTSYNLKQVQYGEIREGTAMLIYVTEDFLPNAQVKSNSQSSENVSMLKLNSTKKFNTGIYPYSILQSSFYPLNGEPHALKIASSIQEWCGQVYMQLNNKEQYEIDSHSYFEGQADRQMKLKKTHLENEIWNLVRIQPNKLPVGEFKMIPSFEYLQLQHKEIKSYTAHGEYYTDDNTNIYLLKYPELNRSLKLYISRSFPYSIEKWKETNQQASGNKSKKLTTTAIKNKQIKLDYWNRNTNKDLYLRDKLDLK